MFIQTGMYWLIGWSVKDYFFTNYFRKAESVTETENYEKVSYMTQTLSLLPLWINFNVESITNDTFWIFSMNKISNQKEQKYSLFPSDKFSIFVWNFSIKFMYICSIMYWYTVIAGQNRDPWILVLRKILMFSRIRALVRFPVGLPTYFIISMLQSKRLILHPIMWD